MIFQVNQEAEKAQLIQNLIIRRQERYVMSRYDVTHSREKASAALQSTVNATLLDPVSCLSPRSRCSLQ